MSAGTSDSERRTWNPLSALPMLNLAALGVFGSIRASLVDSLTGEGGFKHRPRELPGVRRQLVASDEPLEAWVAAQ